MIITIDGPAAAGKSTLAKGLARCLKITYLDSGATYRAAALLALKNGIDLDDETNCAALIRNSNIDLAMSKDGEVVVLINGKDSSAEIRKDLVSEAASRISVHPEVRAELVALQRRIAEDKDVVAEGRDMGSVVFPDADLKFYLDAPIDERGIRRQDELKNEGQESPIDDVIDSINKRDLRDMERSTSPLVRTPDSVYLNNGNLQKEETLKLALKVIQETLGLKVPSSQE